MKKIVIEGCGVCPYRDHNGGFGQIGYIPVCGKMNNKELPYRIGQAIGGRQVVASPTGEIPSWCPLEDNT